MALKHTEIKNLKPKDKLYRVADGNGLCIEVTPKGKKFWRYRYRFNNKPSMITVGKFPDLSLADARTKVPEYQKMLKEGRNPSIYIRRLRDENIDNQSNTFKKYADALLEKKIQEGRKPRTIKKNKTLMKVLEGDLGNLLITEIDSKLLHDTIKKKEGKAPVMAQEALGLASEIFRFAQSTGLNINNPTSLINRGAFASPKTQGFDAIIDINPLRELLRSIEGYSGDILVKCGLLVLAHTLVRPGELREAKWSEIKLEDKIWIIPAERMKGGLEHRVPLSPQVVALFKEMRANRASDDWVMGSRRKANRPMSDMTANKALKSLGYGKGSHHAHGFRKSGSTILNEKRWNADWIEMQLAHVPKDKIRRTYNRAEYWSHRKRMMNHWSDLLTSNN